MRRIKRHRLSKPDPCTVTSFGSSWSCEQRKPAMGSFTCANQQHRLHHHGTSKLTVTVVIHCFPADHRDNDKSNGNDVFCCFRPSGSCSFKTGLLILFSSTPPPLPTHTHTFLLPPHLPCFYLRRLIKWQIETRTFKEASFHVVACE